MNGSKVIYTTSIDADLRDRFKVYCIMHGKYQNQVIEELIEGLLLKEESLVEEGEHSGNTDK